MNRTDQQKRDREPVLVTLGGKEYAIHPKPISHTRKWKVKAKPHIEAMQRLLTAFTNQSKSPLGQAEILGLMISFMNETIEELTDLVFEWEPTLPKDEILDNAFPDEIQEAITAVVFFAFPLLLTLGITPAIFRNMKDSIPNQ